MSRLHHQLGCSGCCGAGKAPLERGAPARPWRGRCRHRAAPSRQCPEAPHAKAGSYKNQLELQLFLLFLRPPQALQLFLFRLYEVTSQTVQQNTAHCHLLLPVAEPGKVRPLPAGSTVNPHVLALELISFCQGNVYVQRENNMGASNCSVGRWWSMSREGKFRPRGLEHQCYEEQLQRHLEEA